MADNPPDRSGALLALWNDVDPSVEAEYNDWHAHEHVPERLTVPGFLWGRRYTRIARIVRSARSARSGSSSEGPRYLTLYGLDRIDVLDSAPYQRLLQAPTPWSRRMRPALRNVSRWACEVRASIGAFGGAGLMAWTFQRPERLDKDMASRVCAMAQALPGVRALVLAEKTASTPGLPWLEAAQSSPVLGSVLMCAELDSAEASPTQLAELETRVRAIIGSGRSAHCAGYRLLTAAGLEPHGGDDRRDA